MLRQSDIQKNVIFHVTLYHFLVNDTTVLCLILNQKTVSCKTGQHTKLEIDIKFHLEL